MEPSWITMIACKPRLLCNNVTRKMYIKHISLVRYMVVLYYNVRRESSYVRKKNIAYY